MIEAFEQQLRLLCERPLDPGTWAAALALRDSWARFVTAAFGTIVRLQVCSWCSRSSSQAGPRCMFCWHRLRGGNYIETTADTGATR